MFGIALPLTVDWIAGCLTYYLSDYRDVSRGVYRVNAGARNFRRPDPDYHHGLVVNAVTTDNWGPAPYPVATNSLGFKDAKPREVPLQWTGPRLLFVGDSFTEGIGVPYPDTWVALVEKALSPRGIAVLNGGVASLCPKTVYYKTKALLEAGLELSSIVFFIDVSDMGDEMLFNDFVPANKDADDVWTGRYIKTPQTPTLPQLSLMYRTLLKSRGRDPWKNVTYTDPATGKSFPFDNHERETWTRGPQPAWLPAAEASAAYYVTKLAALCAAHRIGFELAIYPWPGEVEANDTHSRHRTFWLQYCAEQHLVCYDLHDAFIPADPERRRQVLTQDFIRGDVHWSVAGHRVVADEWLRQYHERHPD